jgi:ABC-type Fe3+-hydroxamate transport system substrate-binding protein
VAAYLWPEAYPTFPVTVTDAAGNEVIIEERPAGAVIIAETSNGLLAELMPFLGAEGLSITFTDALMLPEGQVVFSTDDNLDATEYVVLYDGDTPAEVVSNIALAGDALGERVAALNAIAAYTDSLEAQAAEQ